MRLSPEPEKKMKPFAVAATLISLLATTIPNALGEDKSPTCQSGLSNRAHEATSCAVAYDRAFAEHRFDDALRYAVIGCKRHRNAADCRRAALLPIHMGNQSIEVPQRYANDIRRLAEFVCLSGTNLKQAYGGNATGRECGNLARQFTLANDPEYRFKLEAAARTYFKASYDPRLAARLHAGSCKRTSNRESCEQARNLPAPRHVGLGAARTVTRVNLEALHATTEIQDRELGDPSHANRISER
jgi:hypothetical protein